MSTLPDALVIGPMKAGTTWIQDYMESRPDVGLPRSVKETFFFDRYWGRGVEWYAGFFDQPGIAEILLEVGASYFHHPEAPERIYATLGDIPLVVTLRDPVRRAWSHYLHLRRYGYTRASLKEAVEAYPGILEASRYATCLQRWYAHFSPDNIHLVWQETLAESPDRYAEAVCQALNIPLVEVPEELRAPSNQAAIPAVHAVAAAGRISARILREMGFYRLVNLAKRMGLKRIFFGKPGSGRSLKPDMDEWAWLEHQLKNEMPTGTTGSKDEQLTKEPDTNTGG